MAKADVLQLIQDLSNGLADATLAERYYREAVFDLGKQGWLTQATLLPVTTADTGTYSFPATAIELLALFYDDSQLDLLYLRELEWIRPDWRDGRGTPSGYVRENENDKTFRLYPIPDAASKDFIFLLGSPFGLDFPEYALAIVHTETRDDLPVWLELPIAFRILELEFGRESNHRDPTFSKMCSELSKLLFVMVT